MPTLVRNTWGVQTWNSKAEQLNRLNQVVNSQQNGPSKWENPIPGLVSGTKNPGWKNLIQRRSNASTAYTRKEWNYIFSNRCDYHFQTGHPGDSSWSRCIGSQRNYGSLSAAAIQNTTDAATQDIALSRLKHKLNEATGGFKAMAPLAEIDDLHRTIKGSVEATSTLFRTLLELKRTKGKSAKGIFSRSALQSASKAWLTWNFGMSPLIRDTQSILHSIDEYKHRVDTSMRITSSAKKSGQYKFDQGVVFDNLSFPCTCSYELSYRYVGAFDILLQSANDYSLYQQLGLTGPDVFATAYELIPYSWALDYFVNIGNFLEDTFSSPPGNLRYLVLDRRYHVHILIGAKFVLPASSYVVRQTQKQGEADYFEFERSPTTVMPHTSLRLKTVDEVGKYGLSKLMNLFSILGKDAPELIQRKVAIPTVMRETASGRQAALLSAGIGKISR